MKRKREKAEKRKKDHETFIASIEHNVQSTIHNGDDTNSHVVQSRETVNQYYERRKQINSEKNKAEFILLGMI
ncbi:Hypothetical predicted protein [Mytilus galloprovincialis]|uniref:Uncharacterized protein n=1 Tax=Mytilus galloprovincialis TaxID=29158 RepID=A0A8B6CWI8_MYTGA|nr:Hypothetical predicted protein [Mytilus galloprovincialis]